MKKLVAMLGIAAFFGTGCNSNTVKTVPAPNPQEEAKQIQNDPSLSPEMKTRLMRQEQIGNKQPGTK